MNSTFSLSANFILIILFVFSVSSLAIFLFCLKELRQVSRKLDPSFTEEKFDLYLSRVERWCHWLPTSASLAMLLGLLGTVMGIYTSFGEMQSSGKATIEVLAGGIKDALVTTIVGLSVAIPSLFFHQILENGIQKMSEMFVEKNSNR